MTRQQTLAATVRESKALLERYFAGFDESNCVAAAPNLPNHFLWTLGHVSISMYRLAAKIDGRDLPQSNFIDGPVGDSLRFGTESVSFGSRPKPDASIYPPLERGLEIFANAAERAATAFENAIDADLEKEVVWGKWMVPAWSLATRIAFHNGTHCGQIADLRRALGMKSIFG